MREEGIRCLTGTPDRSRRSQSPHRWGTVQYTTLLSKKGIWLFIANEKEWCILRRSALNLLGRKALKRCLTRIYVQSYLFKKNPAVAPVPKNLLQVNFVSFYLTSNQLWSKSFCASSVKKKKNHPISYVKSTFTQQLKVQMRAGVARLTTAPSTPAARAD